MEWFVIVGLVAGASLIVIAICMTVFGIVAVVSTPADKRVEATRAVGEAWGRWGRRR